VNYLNTQNNFFYFTSALVVLLLASAFVGSFNDGLAGHRLLQSIIFLVELIAYFSLNLNRRWRRFVLFMLALMVLSNVLREVSGGALAPMISLLASLLFFCGTAYAAARQVLFSPGIEWNTIVGTVAVFLLLGLIWSLIHLLALEFWHGGFNGIEYQDWNDNFGAMTYFSFVTMTTLGYGDISPAVPFTRTLVYLQAISGTFYMAVVVASLVSARNDSSN
jgi:voltage-gated potassium channel